MNLHIGKEQRPCSFNVKMYSWPFWTENKKKVPGYNEAMF